nr:cob(I)yrinic acid a,c-diamide adenosyltransferase [Marinicella sp. W31]MDC2878339.1 cob(I)yrinic acid a,c-diamide adenosyltransferase [Marinicella sp. W31]
MVKLNKIYTRTGDGGTTGLATGPRRNKSDLRLNAIGDVDETNATLGLVRLEVDSESAMADALKRIQNDLFDLGADLATPETDEALSYEPLRIVSAQVAWLEGEIDRLNAALSPLTSFILPGGSRLASGLHMARTVCRRAERAMVALGAEEQVGKPALCYINRLSDYLFVAARHANDCGRADILWVPGKTGDFPKNTWFRAMILCQNRQMKLFMSPIGKRARSKGRNLTLGRDARSGSKCLD